MDKEQRVYNGKRYKQEIHANTANFKKHFLWYIVHWIIGYLCCNLAHPVGSYATVADGEKRYQDSYNSGEGWRNPILVEIKKVFEDN